VHDYPGVIFNFSKKGKVMVNMISCIKNIITNFPEEMIKTSPAADNLSKVQEELEAKPLPEEQAMAIHHTTA
jgi:hypothetical protein